MAFDWNMRRLSNHVLVYNSQIGRLPLISICKAQKIMSPTKLTLVKAMGTIRKMSLPMPLHAYCAQLKPYFFLEERFM
jgi:hypothetical protein